MPAMPEPRGIGCEGDGPRIGEPMPPPPSGALTTGEAPGSAIIVFIIPMSPLGFGAAVSSAPHPRQNL